MSQLRFLSKERIDKGWSCDTKYCATAEDGTKYLLRITPREKSANRAEMFRMQQAVAALGAPMCRPVEFGDCDEGVYMVQTWVNGKDAEDVIPHLANSQQYALGLEAGRFLKKIHTVPAPGGLPDWQTRFNAKIDRNLRMYDACPVKFDGDVPFAFWKLLALSISSNTLCSIPWAIRFGDGEIQTMLHQAGEVLVWYDYMQKPIPCRYQSSAIGRVP